MPFGRSITITYGYNARGRMSWPSPESSPPATPLTASVSASAKQAATCPNGAANEYVYDEHGHLIGLIVRARVRARANASRSGSVETGRLFGIGSLLLTEG